MNRSLQPARMLFAIGLLGLGVLAVIHDGRTRLAARASGYLAARPLRTPRACSCSAAPSSHGSVLG
jgi:hypothetical protein